MSNQPAINKTPLQLHRLQDHLASPPSRSQIRANILSGQWPGLVRKPVKLPSGSDIGMGVFASERLQNGVPVAHYPASKYLLKQEYFELKSKDPCLASYAQEVGTSGLVGWNKGPIVLLAHDIPENTHYGHLINHTPCSACCNLAQVVKMVDNRPHLIFRTKRIIEKGEQLLRDYGDQYLWPNKTVECPRCGNTKETGPKVNI